MVHQVGFWQQRKASTIAQHDEAIVMHQHLPSSLCTDVSAMPGHDIIESHGALPSMSRQLEKQVVLLAAGGRQLKLVFVQHRNNECKQSMRLGGFRLQVLVRKHRKREIPDLGVGKENFYASKQRINQ